MDHHGLVAAVCKDLGIAEKINLRIGKADERRVVSTWGNFGTWLRTIRKNTLPSEDEMDFSNHGRYRHCRILQKRNSRSN